MRSITAGLHADMSNEDYHADIEWLSSTRLKALLPERYKAHDGETTPAMEFGTLVHQIVLEPDSLGHYAVLDAAAIAGSNPKTGRPYDAPTMTGRWKAAVAGAEQDGRTVVAQSDWDRAHAMRDALAAHPKAARMLFDLPGENEVSAFWRREDDLRLKARYDRLISGAVLDLKTTSAKPGEHSLRRAVWDYGYHPSAAHYLSVAAGLDLDVETFALVFVGKEPPHYVTVCDFSDDLLGAGYDLHAEALTRFTDPDAEPYVGASTVLTL